VLATAELFDSNPLRANNRLAIDHIVPVLWDNQEHEVHLVIRVGYLVGNQTIVGIFKAKGRFTCEQLDDRESWEIYIETIAYSLVASLKNALDSLTEPSIRILNNGDMAGTTPVMRRVWL
jgi:hypothetical protein